MTSRRDRPRVKLQAIPKFPADVVAGDGIAIGRSGAIYTFSVDFSGFGTIASVDPSDWDNLFIVALNGDDGVNYRFTYQALLDDAAAAVSEENAAPNPLVVSISSSISVDYIAVQTTQSGAIALVLPDSGAWAVANNKYGAPLSVFDISGAASTNNVTITFTGGQLASGLSSLVISSDYGGYSFQPKASGAGWVIV